jgi:hypothetical protein
VLGASLLATLAGSAQAQTVSWEQRDANGNIVASAPDPIPAGDPVTIDALNSLTTRVNVFCVGGVTNIGPISFTANQPVDLVLGEGALVVPPTSSLTPSATNWAGLSLTPAAQVNTRFSGAISGNLTGPITSGSIVRLQVGGEIQSAVDALNDPNANTRAIGAIVAGSTSDTSTITADGSIGPITITGAGGLQGDIASGGLIEALDVSAGPIGSTTNRPIITANDGIFSIVATTINADVNVDADNDGDGLIRKYEATVGAIDGSLDAALLARGPSTADIRVVFAAASSGVRIETDALEGGILIQGDWDAPGQDSFVCNGNFRGGIVVEGFLGEVRIGGDVRCCPLPIDPAQCDPAKNSLVVAWSGIGELEVAGEATNAPDIDRGFDVRTPLISDFSIGGDFAGSLVNLDGISPVAADSVVVNGDVLLAFANSNGLLFGSFIHVETASVLDIKGSIAGTAFNANASGVAYNKPPSDSVYRIGGDVVGYVFASLVDGDGQPNQLIVRATDDAPTTGIVGFGCVKVFHPDGPFFDPVASIYPYFPVTSPNSSNFDYPYDYLPQEWNSGAVGVVPFVEHQNSSDALNNGTIFASQFNRDCTGIGTRDVLIDFYGPIREKSPSLPSARVEMVVAGVPTGVDLSPRLDFEVSPSAFRLLNIRGKPGLGLPAGTYRVTRNSATFDNLLCDRLLTSAEVPVSSELSYDFTLVQDCDCDGQPDASGQSCSTGLCDPIDFNNDGVFPDLADVTAFLDAFTGTPCATCNDIDFNNDGVFPDNNDITIFLSVYSGGACPA